jgi:4-hydroxybenzoate polyprenyltransferase
LKTWVLGVVLGACIAVSSLAAYAVFGQPLALLGLLLAMAVLLVALRIAFIGRMIPTKQGPGERANY